MDKSPISQVVLKNWLRIARNMKKIPTIVPVVAVALIDPANRVLLHQRRIGKAHGGLWEFPGGKVEPAETLLCAMLREAEEELGIQLDAAALEPLSFATSADQPHVVLLYTCRAWQGEVQCLDGEAIAWIAPEHLLNHAMPPLDVPLARAVLDKLKR